MDTKKLEPLIVERIQNLIDQLGTILAEMTFQVSSVIASPVSDVIASTATEHIASPVSDVTASPVSDVMSSPVSPVSEGIRAVENDYKYS